MSAPEVKAISGWVNRLVDAAILFIVIISLGGGPWIAFGVVMLWNSLVYEIRHAGDRS